MRGLPFSPGYGGLILYRSSLPSVILRDLSRGDLHDVDGVRHDVSGALVAFGVLVILTAKHTNEPRRMEPPGLHERMRELCRGITLRLVPADAISRLSDDQLGSPKRVLIARDPDELESMLAIVVREPVCPICGESTEPSSVAFRASLELEFGRFEIGRFVWAHAECFARCIDTGKERGIPW